ncbi:MAG TPA: glycosyltransferase family 61 protein [Pyrinomonadaceae bacterium]|nr:glycosyltransferase family 61 protein [Pyrinomonadaceae bacterium]
MTPILPPSDVTVLRPEHLAIRKLPVNIKQEDLGLFSHELKRVIPQTRLVRHHKVGVSAEGILFQKGRMLPESFAWPANRASWKPRSVLKFLLSNYLVRRRRHIDRESALVTDDWSYGYFHWLADVLPRLLTIQDRLHEVVLLLPHTYKQLEFVDSSLKPFDIGKLEYIDPDEVLVCGNLIMPTQTAPSGHYNEELIRDVGRLMVGHYGDKARDTPSDRVYISRAGAPKRRVVNEEELEVVLERFGFRTIRSEDNSFADQVRISSGVRYLISNHGAGLTNMLFMSPGTNVLELRHATDSINNCYFTLASALNLNYFYQNCEPANPTEDPHSADLKVDPGTLTANIELMLNS